MNEILNVEQLTKTYGKKGEKQYQALKGVSFKLQKGEFVGIMGGLAKNLDYRQSDQAIF